MELFLLEHTKLWRKRIVKICVLLCFIYIVIFGNILSFQWFSFGSSGDYTSAFGNNFDGYGVIRESQEYALNFGEELTDETLQQVVRDYQRMEAAGMECVTSTKSGKRYCPDSKGIPEQVIEEAFVESYKMLCSDNKDILEEFISRVEKTLSEDTARDKLMKYQKSADNLQSKRKTLLEKYLEGVVSQDIYEETDVGYERKLSDIRANIEMLEQQMEDEVSLKRRVEDFKRHCLKMKCCRSLTEVFLKVLLKKS